MYLIYKLHKRLLFLFFLLYSFSLYANNLRVENVSLTGQNTTEHYTLVQFDISWDYSWRNIVNWDAAWIFVKYKEGGGDWQHARLGLNDPDHTAPSGSVINSTNYNDSYAPGVFIYRNANGTGSNDWNIVKLRWNYGQNRLTDDDVVTVKVFAVEMVYVPQASFELGDGSGGLSYAHFFPYNSDTSTYNISAQGAITVGQSTGNLWAANQINAGISDANFPTGYNAFYCMKYEITQEQYVDFLNTLTRTQQNTRTQTDISGTSVTNRYVMSSTSTIDWRNSIRCDANLPASGPITIYCDYDGDDIANEDNDGQNIASNFISWMDGCAYACWAGLRPMTELEFEKACRGDQPAVAAEYAWGNTNIHTSAYTLSNEGFYNEVIASQPSGTGNVLYDITNSVIGGPLRVGIFALSSTSRQEAGASYYGIMELTGSLHERAVSIGYPTGLDFTGNHGGGRLSSNGNAYNVASWPGLVSGEVTDSYGSGSRGGTLNEPAHFLPVSTRYYAAGLNPYSTPLHGFRCVRSAP